MSTGRAWSFGVALFASVVLPVHGQTVYKCTNAGAVSYSHEPCLNARVVDTTPTQGLDQWSGKMRRGADVQAQQNNKLMAEALKPLLNETAAQREQRHRRFKLSPEAKLECERLDPEVGLPTAGPAANKPANDAQGLLKARARYRDLRC